MRYKELLTEQQLDELRMSPGSLRAFAGSSEAEGIRAGFEAELVFTGLGGEADYDEDPEPDYDADERANSIDDVINFFSNDEFGYATYGRDLDNLQDGLDEKYMEWHDDQMYSAFRDEAEDLVRKQWLEERPMTERVHDYLVEGMDLTDAEADRIQAVGDAAPKFETSSEAAAYMKQNPDYARYVEAVEGAEEILEEDVEQSVKEQDGYYDQALDGFRDDFYVDDDSGFFGDVGLRWMSDVASEFQLMWPVMTYTGQSNEGGFSEENARNLATSLSDELIVKTKVSSGYHTAKRDDETWIFEPDMSLDADDSDNMPVEIVSPPMPLEECLRKMEEFFEWAESNGAYANSSTGFHMGVSLPVTGGRVDYVKLALFLGDEHVLKDFGRSGNHFCEAAIKKIRQRVRGNKEAIGGALELMRHNLLELAQKALEINNHGFGKYTSINPQGGNDSTKPHLERGAKYIEFRSAGGSNYFEDIDKLKNTLMRYAKAMTVAANPAAERKEYYKKLYKLISPPEGDPALNLFAQFAAGEISSSDLKKSWAEKQLEAEPKGDWVLYDSYGKRVQGQTYNGYTKTEAWERAKQKLSPGGSMEGFQQEYKFLPSNSETGDWEVYNTETGETLETLRGYETRGAAADAVYDKYVTDQGIPFNLRPVDPEEPEKPLSPREKLAKNIKAQGPAPKVYYKWNIANPKTGETNEDYMTRERVFQTTRKAEKDNPKDGKYTNTIVGKGSVQVKSSEELRDIDEMSFDFRVKGSDDVIEYKRFSRATDSVNGLNSPVVVAIERANELSEELGKPVVAYEVPTKPTQKQDWDVVYKPTGRVIDTILRVDQERAQKLLKDVARLHDFENTDNLELQSKGSDDPDSIATVKRKWEIVDRMDNNRVLDVVDDIDMMQAEAVRLDWVRRAGRGVDANIGKRSVPTAASAERARDRTNPNWRDELANHVNQAQELEPVVDQPPVGFQTQRPAVGDYYEVKSGDRIYGYVSTQAATDNNRSIAIEVKRYIEQLTGRDDAQLVYRAGDPVQVTAPNGIPMWQIYERDSGHVVHEFADHDQTTAWATAQGWLRNIGAEDPSLFSCRPKMST